MLTAYLALISLCLTRAASINSSQFLTESMRILSRQEPSFRLCNPTQIEQDKCQQTVAAALNRSLPLPLQCVQKDSQQKCLQCVAEASCDMVVVHAFDYAAARKAGLKPAIFARQSNDSLYVAVVQRGIRWEDVLEAPLILDHTDNRAYHAAIFFNLRRGHDICSMCYEWKPKVIIQINDISKHVPSAREVLVCPDGSFDEAADYLDCNIEAGLERAVFVAQNMSSVVFNGIKRIFDTILQNFVATSLPSNDTLPGTDTLPSNDRMSSKFNFFSEFQGEKDVIFKDNTIAFAFQPYYRNDVDENVYRELHCNKTEDVHHHDPTELD